MAAYMKGAKMSLITAFRKYLKEASLPMTEEREKIISLIDQIDHHFTVEELLNIANSREIDVSRATIYRTVQILLNAGLITRIIRDDQTAIYETIYNKEHHSHMFCLSCGAIIEFSSPEIEYALAKISREKDFDYSLHSLKVYGICSSCSIKKKK
jgi:Fur family ferric uptake transcriptional regulator